MMVAIILLYSFLLQIQTNEGFVNFNMVPNNIHETRGDFVGNLVQVLHETFTRATLEKQPPSKKLCKTRKIQVGSIEIVISQRPYGFCTYCCPLGQPKRFLNFYFFNKKNRNATRIRLLKKPGLLRSSGIENHRPTIIFIHGFVEHGLGLHAQTIKNAYLNRAEDYNVISVDWGELAALPWYFQAFQNVAIISKILAKFLKFYNDTGELPLSKIHLIGFSLGAQIAGTLGKELKGQLGRITALDPAWVLFSRNESLQISKMAAKYVDVIHTDAGFIGTPNSVGHADFYPNGGDAFQPGCGISVLAERKMIEDFVSCSHRRALKLYVESISNPTAFPAINCGRAPKRCSQGYMGFLAEESMAFGDFYLMTRDREPYGTPVAKENIFVEI